MPVESAHLTYIERYLVPEILTKLDNETLTTYEATHTGGLDGFMSALYNIRLLTKTSNGIEKERLLIAKFMKGDVAFRESSKSYVQFANEVFVYATVLPAYDTILKVAKVTGVSVENWVPTSYATKFGYVEGLSASRKERESVLVLENLKPQGYKLGARLYLNRDHLLSMCRPLGQYHALSYALRLTDDTQLQCLKSGIIPLPFIIENDPNEKKNLYRTLYRLAFDRFYDFFDRKVDKNTLERQSADDLTLIEHLRSLREKYFAEPTLLLERLRVSIDESESDSRFGVILHGDYNRNNVLFKYKEQACCQTEGSSGDQAEVADIKMIDFQELRYGSPALDLSFFMFMNSPESIRDEVWLEVLHEYHSHMFQTLESILKANQTDDKQLEQIEKQLELYNFDNFHAHFKRYAFYGVMVCMHFLPWILCSEEECADLSNLFETNMHGEEFRKISIEAGGDEANQRIFAVLKHASKLGYMDDI